MNKLDCICQIRSKTMSFKCPTCHTDCRPIGTNVVGLEIQEYFDALGWVSSKETYSNHCKALTALKQLDNSKNNYRIYSVFKNRQFSQFESTV